MKKLLALVLALVMSMSLVTISNAAFKDADKIDYKEAVDVMNAVGVFIGDEKGNFNAKENLTREQAAKIIAYLELGSKAADAMVGGNTFTDVASSRWSAGFIAYCAQAGIVSGVGDGKFAPAGQLTALQFGKMLLVELGYDAKAAGMVGTDWAINTSKLMAKAKLMDKIDGSVNQVLTREKAAQMTLNALKAPTVEYTKKVANTNHFIATRWLFMAEDVYQSIPEKWRNILDECCVEAGKWEQENAENDEASMIEFLKDKGVEWNDVDIDAFTEACAPVYDWIVDEYGADPELHQKLVDFLNDYRAKNE